MRGGGWEGQRESGTHCIRLVLALFLVVFLDKKLY